MTDLVTLAESEELIVPRQTRRGVALVSGFSRIALLLRRNTDVRDRLLGL
jgi:hypothetical protein